MALLAVLVLAGCGKGGEQGGEESEARKSPTDGPIKGGAVAKVELGPLGDFDTSGIAAFEEVGGSGVQVDLEVEGLPKPGSTYYAHFHEGRCADVSTDDGYGPEEAHAHGRVGVVLALVRPERLLGWGPGPDYTHGTQDHEHSAPAEDLPGNLEVPIPVSSSSVRTGSTTAVLRDVTLKRLSSGDPKYRLEVHASGAEDAPVLACGTLGEAA